MNRLRSSRKLLVVTVLGATLLIASLGATGGYFLSLNKETITPESNNHAANQVTESGQVEGVSIETTSPTLSPTPKQQYYKSQAPLPTAIPTPQALVQQVQEYKTPWDGFANKEAFCRDLADQVMQQPLPPIDQSNLPPELRITPNLDAMWKNAFESCMNQIRNY